MAFFKEIAKKKARDLFKSKVTTGEYDIDVNVLDGNHKYRLIVNINIINKCKSFSYSVSGIDNTYTESNETISF